MDINTKIKQTINSVVPSAEVFLFGSRARGDNHFDSDWDILILLPDSADYQFKRLILNELLEIELTEKQIFNVIFRYAKKWFNDDFTHQTPFYKSVVKEMISL